MDVDEVVDKKWQTKEECKDGTAYFGQTGEFLTAGTYGAPCCFILDYASWN